VIDRSSSNPQYPTFGFFGLAERAVESTMLTAMRDAIVDHRRFSQGSEGRGETA
jgi:hypothetical protein